MSKPEKKQGSAAVIGIGASAGGLEALQQFLTTCLRTAGSALL